MTIREPAMIEDYPAAHSMDTTWFAVDAAGHVGLFDTGENGHAPDGQENDVRSDLWELYLPPGEREAGDWWDPRDLCTLAGMYYFTYDEGYDPIGPYDRTVAPDSPLHVDQLPPTVRRRCKQLTFPIRFDEIDRFQPLEHTHCIYWYEQRVAYLCSDGKTVRPIAGQESKFAAFVRDLRADRPDLAERYIFDGPSE
jgi:hypothetical protein